MNKLRFGTGLAFCGAGGVLLSSFVMLLWGEQGVSTVGVKAPWPVTEILWFMTVTCLVIAAMLLLGWQRRKRTAVILIGIPVVCLLIGFATSNIRSHTVITLKAQYQQELDQVVAEHTALLRNADGEVAKVDAIYDAYWSAVPQSDRRRDVNPYPYPFNNQLVMYAIIIADAPGAPYYGGHKPDTFGSGDCARFLQNFDAAFDPMLHQASFDRLCPKI